MAGWGVSGVRSTLGLARPTLAGLPLVRLGLVSLGSLRRVVSWRGAAWHGSPLLVKSCHGLSWLVRSRLGGARLPFRVKAGYGRAWPGAAWRGMASLSVTRPGASCPGESRLGTSPLGRFRLVAARQGMARRVRAPLPPSLGMARPVRAWRGEAHHDSAGLAPVGLGAA